MQLPSIVPPPHGRAWPEAPADAAGLHWMWLEEAARFAVENETQWPYDLRLHLESGFFEPPPFNRLLGPIRPRGPANGLVLRRGFKVASWGRHRSGGFHVLGGQELSQFAGGNRGHGRVDYRP